MERTIDNLRLIDESKAPVVKPQSLTVYVPDELPDAPTCIIKTTAVENRPGYQAIINRDITLPTAAVAQCFKLNGLKVEIDMQAAAALLAMFNYQAGALTAEPQ